MPEFGQQQVPHPRELAQLQPHISDPRFAELLCDPSEFAELRYEGPESREHQLAPADQNHLAWPVARQTWGIDLQRKTVLENRDVQHTLSFQDSSNFRINEEHLDICLENGNLKQARKILKSLLAESPENQRLHRLLDLLSYHVRTTHLQAVKSRSSEANWIRRNRSKYGGRWVALDGDRLIVAGDDIGTVLRGLEDIKYDGMPVVHLIN